MAGDDGYATPEDTALVVTAANGVLANDSDPDLDPLQAVLVGDVSNGALTLNADGSLTYTPNANFNGAESFTYRANDGLANSNVATVTLTVTPVSDAPVAVNDSYVTAEDTVLSIAAPGVLGNDTDADGDALGAVLVPASGPSNGTLTLNLDGSFTYTPNANFNGDDSFDYVANDGTLDSAAATVTITVTPVNDPPVAVNDSYTTAEDSVLSILAPGVLGNDTDADGDGLTAVPNAGPANGTLTLNADGSFTYTPNAGFAGSDSFDYVANDGTVDSNVATATITVTPVNDAPVAANDSYTTPEDTVLSIVAPGVLGNDTDADGDTLGAVLVPASGPSNGTLTLNLDGSF
ncbi:MAG: cadherin-like domain-containing protein, partial [Rhodospirillales bacterium]|nr:cadherin-like domain-containing protein [Rhodospirillales bacterium]